MVMPIDRGIAVLQDWPSDIESEPTDGVTRRKPGGCTVHPLSKPMRHYQNPNEE